jgi:hypothetical protein
LAGLPVKPVVPVQKGMLSDLKIQPENGLTGLTSYHVSILKRFATQPLGLRWSFDTTSQVFFNLQHAAIKSSGRDPWAWN